MWTPIPPRSLAIAALRARDPAALTYEESYELYRADLVRDLAAADRDFRAARPPRLWNTVLTVALNGALVAGLLSVMAYSGPMQAACRAWASDGRGPTLIVAGLIGVAAWALRRRSS
jgi:hypothetical protein